MEPITNSKKDAWKLLLAPSGGLHECVVCGEPNQIGRYAGLPVCFPCYETGLLLEWIEFNNFDELNS